MSGIINDVVGHHIEYQVVDKGNYKILLAEINALSKEGWSVHTYVNQCHVLMYRLVADD